MTQSAADLIGAMLGTLFLALGLAAGAAAAFRSVRHDRVLLWFGVFTALYGIRLIARSSLVQTELPLTEGNWEAIISFLTYVILVPAGLLVSSALAAGPRSIFSLLWRVNAVCAVIAIAWAVAVADPGAAMTFNRIVVVANILAALAWLTRDLRSRPLPRDGWIVLSGTAVFAAAAMAETITPAASGPCRSSRSPWSPSSSASATWW